MFASTNLRCGASVVALLLSATGAGCTSSGGGSAGAVCANGAVDPGEADRDCGGICGATCGPGQGCATDGDCTTGACESGLCSLVAPSCDDGRENGSETGVDCGGSCGPCGAGKGCRTGTDCASMLCDAGQCATPATCSDTLLSPGETDLDCGGACLACATGQRCQGHGDCLSATCVFGVCRDPSCDDGVKNQSETGVDCGGPCPDGCGTGERCSGPEDCSSGWCTGGFCTSCDDGIKNNEETDVDCGGPSCGACEDGARCGGSSDCVHGQCSAGICGSCDDRRQSGLETDVDCGGPVCGPCDFADGCQQDSDCSTGQCTSGSCTSCDDDRQTGDETDIDCGGSCGSCGVGAMCEGANDCGSGACQGQLCCVPNACGECSATPDEVCDGADNDCDGTTDEPSEIGPAPVCAKTLGVCAGAITRCYGNAGWDCQAGDYAAHSADYETTESRCDGKDNDCDGQTDEGLTNACGQCGPVPQEICDGLDNDCDGQTDEITACDLCADPPRAKVIRELSYLSIDDHGGVNVDLGPGFVTTIGNDAYAAVTFRSGPNYGSVRTPTLLELSEGETVAEWTLDTLGSLTNMSMTANQGQLSLIGFPPVSTATTQARVTTGGEVIGEPQVVCEDGALTAQIVSNGTVSYVICSWDSNVSVYRSSGGGWVSHGVGYNHNHVAATVTTDGSLFWAWNEDGDSGSLGPLIVKGAGVGSEATIVGHSPSLAAGADGRIHLVYQEAGTFSPWSYRVWDGQGWSGAEQIASNERRVSVQVLPSGEPVTIAHSIYRRTLDIYRRSQAGAWSKSGALDGVGNIQKAAMALDAVGRIHAVVISSGLRYGIACVTTPEY